MRREHHPRVAKETPIGGGDAIATVLAREEEHPTRGSRHHFLRLAALGRMTRKFESSDAAPRKIDPMSR